ncbi:MAG: NAD(P)/FAD-dependent oxidoreductase [Actinomycetota bacterium]|nr:NAD(P)/FAD-dependent oxidoreductase [Actinomycetota bacterium]
MGHAEESGKGCYDAVVVGAGTAGLSAALVLGRSRRRVLILDGGEPRNAPAHASHGFFTRDGAGPAELLQIGRGQLEPYPNVEYRVQRAAEVSGSDGAFELVLEGGETVSARKLVLATGVLDELPARPGFKELWGRGLYHCPYCHGWEVRERPLAVMAGGEAVLERVVLIRNWSRDLVALTDGTTPGDKGRARLAALGVPLNEKPIARLEGKGDGLEGLARVVFEDGSSLEREGLFYGPPQRQRSPLAGALGCEIVAMGPASEVVKADPLTRETSVAGVYAVGDAGSPMQSIALASASGTTAAAFVNHALCDADALRDEEVCHGHLARPHEARKEGDR